MHTIILRLLPLLALSTAAAIPQSGGNGLSFMVPPPTCLNSCIHTLGACTLCTPNNTYVPCINSSCGPKDVSYANAYYGSTCSDGGYISYDTNPPHDFYIASSNQTDCPKSPTNGTVPTNGTLARRK